MLRQLPVGTSGGQLSLTVAADAICLDIFSVFACCKDFNVSTRRRKYVNTVACLQRAAEEELQNLRFG